MAENHRDLWMAYWKNRDSIEAIRELMAALMPLVNTIVQKVAIQIPPCVQVADLFQVASLALFRAIERFDPAYGVVFKSFAYPKIHGAIMDELRSNDHLSRSDRAKANKIQKGITDWINKHSRPPDEEELAGMLKMDKNEIAFVLEKAQHLLSLDQPVKLDEDGKAVFLRDILADADNISPDISADQEDIRKLLRKAFRQLAPREQKILYLYYFEELRLSEIAALFNVTEARISQIHALAIIKLRLTIEAFEYRAPAGETVQPA